MTEQYAKDLASQKLKEFEATLHFNANKRTVAEALEHCELWLPAHGFHSDSQKAAEVRRWVELEYDGTPSDTPQYTVAYGELIKKYGTEADIVWLARMKLGLGEVAE